MSGVSQFPRASSPYLFMSMALFNPMSTFSPLSIIQYFLPSLCMQRHWVVKMSVLCLFGCLSRAVGEGVQRGEHRPADLPGEEIHKSGDGAQSR